MLGTVQPWMIFKSSFTVSYSKSGKETATTLSSMATCHCPEELCNLSSKSVRCLWDFTCPVKAQLLSMQLPTEQQYGKEIMSSYLFFSAFSPNSLFCLIKGDCSNLILTKFYNISLNNKNLNISIPWINLYFISYCIFFFPF